MQVLFEQDEALNIFHNALCNVGSAFNAYGLEIVLPEDAYAEARKKLDNPCIEDVAIQMLKDGSTIEVIDHEGKGEYTRKITLADVLAQVPLIPVQYLADILTENDDAITADIVLQTVFFKETIFG